MELKMFIGQKLIDASPVNLLKIKAPGYLNLLKAELEEKNEEILDLSDTEPEFFLDEVPSSMNVFAKKPQHSPDFFAACLFRVGNNS